MNPMTMIMKGMMQGQTNQMGMPVFPARKDKILEDRVPRLVSKPSIQLSSNNSCLKSMMHK